jgi:hypothetical protein
MTDRYAIYLVLRRRMIPMPMWAAAIGDRAHEAANLIQDRVNRATGHGNRVLNRMGRIFR